MNLMVKTACLYERYKTQPGAFLKDIIQFLNQPNAYIVKTPDTFLIFYPYTVNDSEVPNSWFLFMAIGKAKEFWKYEPYQMEYISYKRKNRGEVTSLKSDKFQRLCNL